MMRVAVNRVNASTRAVFRASRRALSTIGPAPTTAARRAAALASVGAGAAAVSAALWSSTTTSMAFADESSPSSIADVVARADDMYDNPSKHSRQELYDTLKNVDLDSLDSKPRAEILWRLTRATYELSQNPLLTAEEKAALIREAYEYVQRAVESDDDNFKCHSWFGIILNEVGDIEGTKKKISYLYIVKDHWLKAAELNPNDATSQHLLGRWCYGIVTISSVMYWAARALFGKLPDTSWDEAYGFFAAAEKIDPGFWKKNLVMLGICAHALNRPDEAREHLLKALLVPVKTHEDRESHKEAKELLQKHFSIVDAPEYQPPANDSQKHTVAELPQVTVVAGEPPAPKRRAPHPKMGGGWCPAGYGRGDPAQKAAKKKQEREAAAAAQGNATAPSDASSVDAATSSSSPDQKQGVSRAYAVAGGLAAGTALFLTTWVWGQRGR